MEWCECSSGTDKVETCTQPDIILSWLTVCFSHRFLLFAKETDIVTINCNCCRPTPPRKRSETLPEDLEGNLADLDDDGIEMDDMTDAQIYTFHDTDHTFSSATNNGVAMGTGILRTSHVATEKSHSTMNACEDVNTCSENQQGRVGIRHSRSPDFGRLMHEDSYMSDAESEAVVKKTR